MECIVRYKVNKNSLENDMEDVTLVTLSLYFVMKAFVLLVVGESAVKRHCFMMRHDKLFLELKDGV